jgi:hypothetical protein
MPVMPQFAGKTVQQAHDARVAAGFTGGGYGVSSLGSAPWSYKINFQDKTAGVTYAANVSIALGVDAPESGIEELGMIWGS